MAFTVSGLAALVDNQCIATLGEPFTYSRPQGPSLQAVSPFSINGIPTTDGEYESPDGKVYGHIRVRSVSIPLGPQKGDLIVVSNPTSVLSSGTYVVQEIFEDKKAASARLFIRWTGK